VVSTKATRTPRCLVAPALNCTPEEFIGSGADLPNAATHHYTCADGCEPGLEPGQAASPTRHDPISRATHAFSCTMVLEEPYYCGCYC
jgi:hypothetical protein